MPHSAVGDRQRSRTKHLRLSMNRAETLLWRYLKAHHLDGFAFRRQAPMGPYIVDFVSHAVRLVVEIDGSTPDNATQLSRDRLRDEWLASRGYRVLRLTNDQVMSSLEGVLLTIGETAKARRDIPPSPPLPRKGGGSRIVRGARSSSIGGVTHTPRGAS